MTSSGTWNEVRRKKKNTVLEEVLVLGTFTEKLCLFVCHMLVRFYIWQFYNV